MQNENRIAIKHIKWILAGKGKLKKNDAPNFRSSVNEMDGMKSCKAAFPRTGGCAAAVAKQ